MEVMKKKPGKPSRLPGFECKLLHELGGINTSLFENSEEIIVIVGLDLHE
jgi:hypothetical protein